VPQRENLNELIAELIVELISRSAEMDTSDVLEVFVKRRSTYSWLCRDEHKCSLQLITEQVRRGGAVLIPPGRRGADLLARDGSNN
jgi:hypothetical protein